MCVCSALEGVYKGWTDVKVRFNPKSNESYQVYFKSFSPVSLTFIPINTIKKDVAVAETVFGEIKNIPRQKFVLLSTFINTKVEQLISCG